MSYTVLEQRRSAADPGQSRLAAALVQLFEAVKAVAAVSIFRQASVTLPSLSASFSNLILARMIFCSLVMQMPR